ncbi:MAG: hypothetical protein Q4B64_06660 [Spirochaetales bacterium]|nr:hypothetical protein [Spirochaetales bacterium]
MNKKTLFLSSLMFLAGTLFAEELMIHSVLVSDFIKDEKNVLRYQPLNIFDNSPDTVYAVSIDKDLNLKPLIKIYFAKPVEMDSLSIKAGYFDSRYYSTNHRIKKLLVTIKNGKTAVIENKPFTLKDEMKEQKLDLQKTAKATELYIAVEDLYSGSKWNDLVISDLNFYSKSSRHEVSFGYEDSLSIYGESHYNRKFDDKGQLLSETVQYGKSGSKDSVYTYNEYGQLITETNVWDDPDYPEIKRFTYASSKDKFPASSLVTYNADGSLKTVVEKVTKKITKTSYYLNNLCIAESYGSRFICYAYDGNKKKFGMEIVSRFPMFIHFEYDPNGNPKEETWYEHSCNWGYPGYEE